MAVLVTGLGYIGTALAGSLLDQGETVVGMENGFSTVPGALARLKARPRFHLVRGSVTSARSIERAFDGARVGTVFHLAAQASGHPQAAAPSYTERTNLVAPRLVFEAAARHGVTRFVFGSSFRVYGDELAGTIDESRPYGRVSDLSHLSKIYAEKLLEMLTWQHRLAVASVRLGVVYGLGPAMKSDPRFLTVPNLFCLRAARDEPLIVNPGARRPIGFVHLQDAVQALILAAEHTEQPQARAYNALSEVLTVGEVGATVARIGQQRGLSVRVEGAGLGPATRWRYASSLEAVGFRPTRTMAESLPEVLEYYLQSAGVEQGRVR
ncbi:MAG TPA: NAD(P)-dependent oxidoreductase [Chloroflexota bacterium]|nr:NAD(P)-dependent oxidoreductase [Chloroflexota bacterium]